MTRKPARQTRGHLIGKYILLVVLIVAAAGCSASKRNAVDIYDNSGNRLVKATDTYELNQVYPYHYDDVYQAAYKTLFRNGFQIEREDQKTGVIQASKIHYQIFSGGALNVPYTVSVQVKEVSTQPRTRIQMFVDAHWGIPMAAITIAAEPPAQKYGPQLVADLQKVLSTY